MSGLVENGRIKSADITFSRGFILDCWVHLEFESTGQGFGGWVLGGNPFDNDSRAAKHGEQANLAADFIGGVMAVADVDKFSALPGKVIRVERETPWGSIVAIGHPFKDRWYRPAERFELLCDSGGHAERENAERSGAVEAEGCQSGAAKTAHRPKGGRS